MNTSKDNPVVRGSGGSRTNAGAALAKSAPSGNKAQDQPQQSKPSAPNEARREIQEFVAKGLRSNDADLRGKLEKLIHVEMAGDGVLTAQYKGVADPIVEENATSFLRMIRDSVKPRDALEELLCVQMAWTHARLARLNVYVASEKTFKGLKIFNEAADGAANTYRRQLLALNDYRNLRRANAFTAIKQANIAQQQVIQQNQNEKSENTKSTNEQGLPASPALLSHVEGLEFPERIGQPYEAVAAEHRPEHTRRQNPIQNERPSPR